ncbi:Transposase [Thermoplasmatales archaeon]|nr:Transposase [Thermoplasmatales archaeon]
MAYPDWVLKYRKKGTLIARRGDRYYLYRVSSHWDSIKKRPQLKTEEYLGRITPDGLIEPKAKRIMKRYDQITVKEYGASFLLYEVSDDLRKELSECFPEWKEIFIFACMRLMYTSPMKNVEFHYSTSYISEMIPDAHVSPESLGNMLRITGMDRASQIRFMKAFMNGDRYLAVDLTHVLSMSDGIVEATLGHNSMEEYLPQVQLLFLFSLSHDRPAYFRILPGSINSVMSLKTTMEESGASNIVMVADTGFYSGRNLKELERMKISYIIPLRRNSRLIDYSLGWEKYFMFQDHPVFYSRYEIKGTSRTMFTFRNDFLKAEEEKDYLRRHEKATAEFRRIAERFGTISVITNLHVSGEIVYDMLKSRVDIEQAYDTFKNTIHADRTYMRDDQQLSGWMFVNFIALILHYRIYSLLMKHDALKKYSPKDVLDHMERINMLHIGDEWKMSEIPKKTRAVMEKLEIPIMQNSGS